MRPTVPRGCDDLVIDALRVGRLAPRHSMSVMAHSSILSGAGVGKSRFFTSFAFSGHVSKHQHSAHHRPGLTSTSRSAFRVPGVTRRSPRRPGSKAPRRCRIGAAGRGQRAVLTRSLQKGTCDVVAMHHHGETENPLGMFESLEDRLLLRAVLMPRDWKPVAGPDQLRPAELR